MHLFLLAVLLLLLFSLTLAYAWHIRTYGAELGSLPLSVLNIERL